VTWRDRLIAIGARHIDDDPGFVFEFGMEFVLDGGEGAEEEVASVGHDGGAARVDLVPGLELIEFAEGAVDNDRGAEFLGVADEGCRKVGLVEVLPVLGRMFGAEAGVGVGDGQTAESLAGKTMLAMKLNRGGCDASGFVAHGQFLSGGAGTFHFGKSWYTPRLFSYEWQIKELRKGESV
jgi:hypothetical protein